MNPRRLLVGIVVVATLSTLGYAGYIQYLAPTPEATPTPEARVAEKTPALSLVSAEGEILPAREAVLAFRVSGRVAEVLVEEGQRVETGDVLVLLESADLEAQVTEAEAAVAQAETAVALAEAQRDQALAGARPEEVAVLEAQIKASQAAVNQAAAQRDDVASGPSQDAIAQAEAQLAAAQAAQKEAQIAYDDVIEHIEFLAGPTEEKARYSLNAANQQLAAARAALDRLLSGADPEQLASANSAVNAAAYQREVSEAQLELAQADPTAEQVAVAEAGVAQAKAALEVARAALEAARVVLEELALLAPFDGRVTALYLEAGEVTVPGAPAMVLADLSHWQMVTSDLSETDVVNVQPDQTATVTVDAFPGQDFSATVREISLFAETHRGNVTYAVTLDLEPTDAPLRWGMTAFVDIRVGSP